MVSHDPRGRRVPGGGSVGVWRRPRLEASARAGPLISASHETFHLMLAPPHQHQPPHSRAPKQHTAAEDSNITRRLASSCIYYFHVSPHPPSSHYLRVPCTRRLVESRRLGLVSKHSAARPAQSNTVGPGRWCGLQSEVSLRF